MPEMLFEQEIDRLQELNAARRGTSRTDTILETKFEQKFNVSQRLVVYGTLAPGRVNHNVLAEVHGEWTPGVHLEGEFSQTGWGSTHGFPAMNWVPGGHPIQAWLLRSEKLPELWTMLDNFEGPEYRRLLVPVFDASGGFVSIANTYEAAVATGNQSKKMT
jgi:gamma-glutamylcyclotransferase (GGCT)/AIG2-like uncharacterized protein YtfP